MYFMAGNRSASVYSFGGNMVNLLIVFVAVLLAFLFLWMVLTKKKETDEKPDRYTCSHCGDQHCNCRKDEAPH